MAVAIAEPQDPEIDMSKAHLHLIVGSDDVEREARQRRRERGSRLSVIDGGKQATAAPGETPWDAMLDLLDLGILAFQANYLTFAAASLIDIELYGRADPNRTN
jgi:hypothetical protein